MGDKPESRRVLGPLLGKMKSLLNASVVEAEPINWVTVLNGYVGIGHRPKVKQLQNLKKDGVSHIFTLLSEKEGAKQLETAFNQAGLDWIWLPLTSAEPPGDERVEEIRQVFSECKQQLETGAKIYIHCSAGIHRTGMISYALLRFLGYDVEVAKCLLAEMREITAEQAGADRLAWSEQFAP